MSVQFGLATLRLDNITFGYMQNVSLDFNFEQALLYDSVGLYPIDVRTHTGNISGTAEYADLNAVGVNKLLGGSQNSYGVVTISTSSSPEAFQVLLNMETDGKTFRVTLNSCRSTKLSIAWTRDGHIIPNFDFQAFADSNGVVGTIILEDVS